MKRSEALAILSRDHHQSLFAAHKLRHAREEGAIAARARLESYWEPDGRLHFQLEEELLLPAYAAYADPYDPLVLRVLGDHVAIRAQVRQVLAQIEPTLAALDTLGAALAEHVRREERELFGAIEQAMPAAELLELAHTLERATAERRA